ncbi:hypothetical protein SAMD00019534_065990 [Acytostelium subglobosum LB1]|uniref:hypothetical protein n=1 Tax=Acytostelium subglobosum LB1 TaxID=1410327 RepID=UPI0006449986|nr:hypothetical protein SAMD00019534_065990 [Acytostelium subglobosum LB1]GAM23424.1 hypothetical protein SAMD00019534_065990 [Acytostelium subglobosum LB1]|eukprot:XP_012753873.1 hypothetical protein SAMD00019534_065990 [Acytostelium subglobosum LB1]
MTLINDTLSDSSNDTNQSEAAWCITNIAAGTHEQTATIIHCTPLLISYLSIENTVLQEQCTWALLNIAIDCPEYKEMLIAQGIVHPLIRLFSSTSSSVTTFNCCCLIVSLITTSQHQQQLVGMGLIACLKERITRFQSASSIDTLCELLWLLNDIVSMDTTMLTLHSVVNQGYFITLEGVLLDDTPAHIVLPIIRTLGLLFTDTRCASYIMHNNNTSLKSLLAKLIARLSNTTTTGQPPRIIKEIIYLLSNISAIDPTPVDGHSNNISMILVQAGCLPMFDSCLYQLDPLTAPKVKVELIYLIHNLSLDPSVRDTIKQYFKHIVIAVSAVDSQLLSFPESIRLNIQSLSM